MFRVFFSSQKTTILLCVILMLSLTNCAVKAPTLNTPTISLEKAKKFYNKAKNLDNPIAKYPTKAYQLYKQACLEGNHLESCLEIKEYAVKYYTLLDIENKNNESEDDNAKIMEQIAAIYNQQCQEGSYSGCFELASLLESVAYKNYFSDTLQSGKDALFSIVDIPLMIGTIGLYGILCPFDMCAGSGFVANKTKALSELAQKTREKGQQLLLQGCINGDDEQCLFAKQYQEACKLGNLEGCLHYVKTIPNNQIESMHTDYEKKCLNGEKNACLMVAAIYSAENNEYKYTVFLEKACDLNSSMGCRKLAEVKINKEQHTALDILQKTCRQGDVIACEQIAIFYVKEYNYIKALGIYSQIHEFYKRGLTKSIDEQKLKYIIATIENIKELEDSCQNGETEKCGKIANIYYRGTDIIEKNTKKALGLYANLCIQNNNSSYCNLAGDRFYEQGRLDIAENFYIKANIIDGKKDKQRYVTKVTHRLANGCFSDLLVDQKSGNGIQDRTIGCFHRMCKEKDPEGCRKAHLIGMAFQGKNQQFYVKVNSFKSANIFEENCANGFGLSCIALSRMYLSGEGVRIDKNKAKKLKEMGINYLKESCEYENGNDCVYLADEVLDTNPKHALTLYNKGCSMGNSFACIQVGKMYEKGIGSAKNINKAKDFYGQACDFQDQEGCSNYNRLSQ